MNSGALHFIEFLSPEDEINPSNDNVDVVAHLDDGRVYLFLVATPNNISWCMENEGLDYFFGVPPVFVKELSRASVEKVIGALVADGTWLHVYGSLQE